MADVSPVFRRGSVPAAIDTRFLDHLPSAVMLCDPASLVIRYANGRAVRLLESVRHMLPVPPEEMVGSALSLLHPAFEEVVQLIEEDGDPSRKLVLTGHGERLEFHVQALRDMNGRPGFLQVTWSVTTAVVAQEEETARLRELVEQLPLNVMTCRLSDMTIDYANAAARAAFAQVRSALAGAGDALVGAPVGLFVPGESIGNINWLPLTMEIPAGDRVIALRVSPLRGPKGQYLAPFITFDVRPVAQSLVSPGQPLFADDVLESLRTSIGRIRNVTQTIERISAQGRGGVLISPLPAGPHDASAGAVISAPAPVPTPSPEEDATGDATLTEDGSQTHNPSAASYASRFGRHVGRLLGRDGGRAGGSLRR